jgi:hypothetical protein
MREQTFLDPLNPQSEHSAALLVLYERVVLADEAYRQRLLRHYIMFKEAVEDPAHPCRRLIGEFPNEPRGRSRREPIPPPPARRGKRRRWR